MIFISFTFGSLFAQDINEISVFTFASSTGHEFSINNGTAALDFEGGKGTYNIDIECTYGGGLEEGMAQGTITVADSNENPAVQALTLNVEENAPKRKATQHAVNIVDSRSNTTSASIHDATLLFLSGSSGSASSKKLKTITITSGSASSRLSEMTIEGIDRMVLPREDALSSSKRFSQRASIFKKMMKKIHGHGTFFFIFFLFLRVSDLHLVLHDVILF